MLIVVLLHLFTCHATKRRSITPQSDEKKLSGLGVYTIWFYSKYKPWIYNWIIIITKFWKSTKTTLMGFLVVSHNSIRGCVHLFVRWSVCNAFVLAGRDESASDLLCVKELVLNLRSFYLFWFKKMKDNKCSSKLNWPFIIRAALKFKEGFSRGPLG